MSSQDPWGTLPIPEQKVQYRSSRVDARHPWGFFWARDIQNAKLLIFQHDSSSCQKNRLPTLKGLEVEDVASTNSSQHFLSFKLLQNENSDIFYRLCMDIVECARVAKSEPEAISKTIGRSWRWHHLLRGSSSTILGPELQKGLIGELKVLENHLLDNLPALASVQSWMGPFDGPKDFEINRIAIESKARRGGAPQHVQISSENQLDTCGVDSLYLHVVELDVASSDSKDGFTLSDKVEQVKTKIEASNPSATLIFENALIAAGYRTEDDYSENRWAEGKSQIFQVSDEFPRLTPDKIHSGVSMVKYRILLDDCAQFEIDPVSLSKKLKEQ